MRALIRKLFGRIASQPQGSVPRKALPLPYRRYTLDDWRASPERVSYTSSLLRDPMFLDLLGMLSNARLHPLGPVDATTAARLLGQREGSDLVISALLKAATSPPTPPVEIEADYGAENLMATWEREGDMNER